MTPARALHLAAWALAATATLGGCAAGPPPDAAAPGSAASPTAAGGGAGDRAYAGPPLPPNAQFEEPSQGPADVTGADEAAGSLRPDGRAPADLVPEIVRRGRLVVGVDQSLYLVSYHDPKTGVLAGFEIDLAREIARDIFGDPEAVEFRFIEPGARPASVLAERVDLVIQALSITRQRQDQVEFSTPYLTGAKRLLVPAGSPIEDFDDIGDATVCVAQGSTSLDLARTLGIRSLNTQSWSDCLVALQQHQVDAILADDILLSGMAAQDGLTRIVGEPISRKAYGVAAARAEDGGELGLVRQVNSTIERIRADGTWAEIFDAWFGPWLGPSAPPPLHYREEDQ